MKPPRGVCRVNRSTYALGGAPAAGGRGAPPGSHMWISRRGRRRRYQAFETTLPPQTTTPAAATPSLRGPSYTRPQEAARGAQSRRTPPGLVRHDSNMPETVALSFGTGCVTHAGPVGDGAGPRGGRSCRRRAYYRDPGSGAADAPLARGAACLLVPSWSPATSRLTEDPRLPHGAGQHLFCGIGALPDYQPALVRQRRSP